MSKMIIRSHNHGNLPFENGFFSGSLFRPFFDAGDLFGSSAFRVDVKDQTDHYELEAELPGVPQEQIDISVEDGVLTISANMNLEKQEERQNYIYSERRMGRYQRSFDLTGIREDGISASYKHGVLYLHLPKEDTQKQPNRRRIDIN